MLFFLQFTNFAYVMYFSFNVPQLSIAKANESTSKQHFFHDVLNWRTFFTLFFSLKNSRHGIGANIEFPFCFQALRKHLLRPCDRVLQIVSKFTIYFSAPFHFILLGQCECARNLLLFQDMFLSSLVCSKRVVVVLSINDFSIVLQHIPVIPINKSTKRSSTNLPLRSKF